MHTRAHETLQLWKRAGRHLRQKYLRWRPRHGVLHHADMARLED